MKWIFATGLALALAWCTGCSLFTSKNNKERPLEFSRENYAQADENGSAVFTLSERGRQAKAGKGPGAAPKKKKKPWWKFW